MAAGFKQATVNASDVPATLTDYPAYVDLSRLGITTLAEAESVRVYADSGKTTEWAREIVSATEMHVKIPSLTSSTVIYVDWDGVRADYAVGATYGRNAVWTSFAYVAHMEDTENSTGGTDLTNTGSTPFGAGYIGNAAEFNGINDRRLGLTTNNLSWNASNDYTWSMWLNINSFTNGWYVHHGTTTGANRTIYLGTQDFSGNIIGVYCAGFATGNKLLSGTLSTATDYKVEVVKTGTTYEMFINNSSVDTATSGTYGESNNAISLGTTQGGFGVNRMNGDMDEFRTTTTALSANWRTTEYNNQSDEAGFWGTWTDAGGGGGTPYRSQFRAVRL